MSDIIGYNEPLFIVKCNSCKNKIAGFNCKAFDRIPNEIIDGDIIHDHIIEGQKGKFIYEKED
jgi:hypothetical protein